MPDDGALRHRLRELAAQNVTGSADGLICGRRLHILCVLDDYTRERLALVADTSLSVARMARELTSLMRSRGKLHPVGGDNGTELTNLDINRKSI